MSADPVLRPARREDLPAIMRRQDAQRFYAKLAFGMSREGSKLLLD